MFWIHAILYLIYSVGCTTILLYNIIYTIANAVVLLWTRSFVPEQKKWVNILNRRILIKEIKFLDYFSLDSIKSKLDILSFVTLKGNYKEDLVDLKSFVCNVNLSTVKYNII